MDGPLNSVKYEFDREKPCAVVLPGGQFYGSPFVGGEQTSFKKMVFWFILLAVAFYWYVGLAV